MEQAQLGPDRMPDGWLTLREPTADFFDARRREELSSASSSRRRPATNRLHRSFRCIQVPALLVGWFPGSERELTDGSLPIHIALVLSFFINPKASERG